ncbi:electron transfer flavoprotein subunit beta/FixA family protein [Aquipuribacter sp. MA13-6]|uniref:electron transfer flavoprotein subunit beta/FixA family protein n=1 Tax=unclassified Aquipuribacter TaxID=2635084 RepID=UPI003EE91DFF
MKIVVCVKHVPDAQSDRGFAADTTTDREAVDGLLSELDEYAVEEAVRLKEAGEDVEVVALTIGPADARDALKKALQMGADSAVHVSDEGVHGSDAVGTSLVLAKALEHTGFDLVVTGMASTDGGMGVVPAMVAERLGLPQVTYAAEVTLSGGPGGTVRIRRDGDASTETIEATLPALVSVTDQINEPRYPSFKGIMAAKKKPVEELTLADLGVDAAEVGLDGAWSRALQADARPPKAAGTVVTDEGDGAAKLVDFLASARLV